jgi:FMN reductase
MDPETPSREAHIVGISGNWSRPSRTRTLVQAVLDAAASRGLGRTTLFDLVDAGPALGQTTERSQADGSLARILDSIESADALVVGTAVYKGAYTGMFKLLFDLFAMEALAGKAVLLTATGAAPAHASVIDYHLRPLFLFFDARVGTRGLYGLPPDFETPERLAAAFRPRIERSVDELAQLLQGAGQRRAASGS